MGFHWSYTRWGLGLATSSRSKPLGRLATIVVVDQVGGANPHDELQIRALRGSGSADAQLGQSESIAGTRLPFFFPRGDFQYRSNDPRAKTEDGLASFREHRGAVGRCAMCESVVGQSKTFSAMRRMAASAEV